MLPDIQPGNTKILYFFNCLLDGMHTIQHAATKVTNIGNKLSSKASPLLRKSELLYIRDKISYNDIKYYFAFLQKDRESGV